MITRTYIVGENNTVRRRDNHTGSWIDISIPAGAGGETMTCYDVMADPNDPDRVVVVGEINGGVGSNTGIMVSYDAGTTWFQPTGTWLVGDRKLYEVWWVDSSIIWVVGSNGLVATSVDGGANFIKTPVEPEFGKLAFTSCIHALNKSIAVVAGSTIFGIGANDVIVYKTTDGGSTWTRLNGGNPLVNTVVGGSSRTGSPNGIWISPDEQEIIVSTYYNQFRTTNGGLNNGDIASVAPETTRSGLHLTWYPSHDPNPQYYRHVGGNSYQVIESTDSGVSWASTRQGDQITIRGAHFYSANEGYYVTGTETYSTNDGAVTGDVTDVSPNIMNAVWTQPAPNIPPCGCPEGFDYNETTDLCERTETVSANCLPTTYTVSQGNQILPYGINGANFYETADGRPLPINESSSTLQDASNNVLNVVSNVQNSLWGDTSAVNGRLNAIGVWSTVVPKPTGEWIGFTTCVDVPADGVYSIGIAADNYVRFRIDGQEYVTMQTGSTWTFNFWHVIPVTLTAGQHVIELEGYNITGQAAFGAEIYSSDVAALAAMTTQVELDAVTVFSTADKIGSTFDLGSESGCSCPNGYVLSNCDGELVCTQLVTVPFQPCNCYLATNCEDPEEQIEILLDPADDPLDLNQIYVFDFDPDKCWTIETYDQCDPLAPFVSVTDNFTTCDECIGTCYELTNCEDQTVLTVDDPSLAQYVGNVIEIQIDPDTTACYQVTAILCPDTTDSLPGTVIDCHTTCEKCLPPPPEPPEPLVLNNRTVKPGYNTKNCPPDYVDMVDCKFAEAFYQQMASDRYGIEFCCNQDLQKWLIKKELLDLDMTNCPDACEPSCNPPNNVTALIVV